MLLAGLGIGALASQLGAVTVSSVPDEQRSEVAATRNTFADFGASLGTALAGLRAVAAAAAATTSTALRRTPPCRRSAATTTTQFHSGTAATMSDGLRLQVALDKAEACREGRRPAS